MRWYILSLFIVLFVVLFVVLRGCEADKYSVVKRSVTLEINESHYFLFEKLSIRLEYFINNTCYEEPCDYSLQNVRFNIEQGNSSYDRIITKEQIETQKPDEPIYFYKQYRIHVKDTDYATFIRFTLLKENPDYVEESIEK